MLRRNGKTTMNRRQRANTSTNVELKVYKRNNRPQHRMLIKGMGKGTFLFTSGILSERLKEASLGLHRNTI